MTCNEYPKSDIHGHLVEECPELVAIRKERDEGLEGLEKNGMTTAPRKNTHETVKPTDLMRYLVRLVTPPGGVVLDPFMGSGSTGKAAKLEGFSFIGIERDPEYFKIAEARIC